MITSWYQHLILGCTWSRLLVGIHLVARTLWTVPELIKQLIRANLLNLQGFTYANLVMKPSWFLAMYNLKMENMYD